MFGDKLLEIHIGNYFGTPKGSSYVDLVLVGIYVTMNLLANILSWPSKWLVAK